jgi:hypothetical protein
VMIILNSPDKVDLGEQVAHLARRLFILLVPARLTLSFTA